MNKNDTCVCLKCGYTGSFGNGFFSSVKRRCKKCLAQTQREYRKKKSSLYWQRADRKHTLKKRYGLTLEAFEKIINKQNYKCAICKKDPRDFKLTPVNHARLQVDHNHTTGKLRGLVCNGCNRALSFINDNLETAKNLVKYIKKHEHSTRS